jgi:hypothetical protein
MTQPIFYFAKLKAFDKWTIGLYLILTFGLSYYFLSTGNIKNKRDIVFGYALITQLGIYGLCYKSLRNLTVFSVWFVIGLFHLYIYYYFRDDSSLDMLRGHSTSRLRNTIPLLFIFQVLRVISLKIQHQELVSPSRGFTTDLFDERKVNWLDFILFFIYYGYAITMD